MPIPASYLRDLKDGDVLEVQVLVSLDGTGDKLSATPLTLSPAYSIKRASGVIVDKIVVGNAPSHLVLSPDNTRLYVANAASKTVSVIDTATREIVATINLTYEPQGITIHPTRQILYVSIGTTQSNYYHALHVIDTTSLEITATITAAGYYPNKMTVNPSGSRLYAGNNHVYYALEYNTLTNEPVRTLVGYAAGYISSVAVNPAGTRVYSTGYYTNAFDQATGTQLSTYNNGTNIPAQGLAHNPRDSKLYVTLTGSVAGAGSVHILSTATDTLTLFKNMGSFKQPWGIVFNPITNRAYFTELGNNTVHVIDTLSETVIDSISSLDHPLDRPKDIVVDKFGTTAYVANSGDDSVLVIDL